MRPSDRILSQPLTLHWAGWTTDTFRLQQAGWSISAEQDISYQTMRLALRHEAAQMRAITDRIPFHYMEALEPFNSRFGVLRNLTLPVVHMANRIMVNVHETPSLSAAFEPIDAQPMYLPQWTAKELDDYAHFAPSLARTKQIIVPEPDVDELLQLILAKQQPAKTEYFKQQLAVNRDGMRLDAMPRQKFHAQILSVA